MTPSLHDVIPAETGWWAFYKGELLGDTESSRVVAWALVDGENGARDVVGFVVSQDDPTRIVLAPDASSALAPELERYGFREE
jgi:hypothetical protein